MTLNLSCACEAEGCVQIVVCLFLHDIDRGITPLNVVSHPSLPSQGPGQSMCALVLRDVSKSSTSGHSPVDFQFHDICSDCFHLLHAAQIRAGTLVARSTGLRQTSSTVMLPQVAGLLVRSSRCTQRWLVHATPVVITVALRTPGVFDDSDVNSPRVVWQLHLCWVGQRLFERCESDFCVVTCAKSVAMAENTRRSI